MVVDASVLRAAGLTAHDTSRRCREFLREVLEICHRAVLSQELQTEWDRHPSNIAVVWRAEMQSRRKIITLGEVRHDKFRSEVDEHRPAIRKDLHLIEAALATDSIVISLDDTAREFFRVESAKNVLWINPVAEGGHVTYWLRTGAGNRVSWQLGTWNDRA